jgi:hypothetical protein
LDIDDYIERIIEKGDIRDMNTLSDILEELMKVVKDYDTECYKKYEMELYKMAYGNTLSKELAEKIVNKMKPYGEKWTMNETMDIQERYGLDRIKSSDFYIVLNSAYNDFNNLFGDDIDMYVRYTEDFINDEDAVDGKVFLYYTTIPRK